MIRIDRGPEPESLTLERDEHLARARLRGAPPQEIHGYDAARDTLAERQRYKCAYCELTIRHEAAPVEHYRPKARADDVDWRGLQAKASPTPADLEDDARFGRGLPPSRDGFSRVRWRTRPGYWWLAWTWENIVFGCSGCNSGVKNSRFPQTEGALMLEEHEAPPGREGALLLDPTDPAADPLDHIRYLEVYGRWIPTPRDESPQGAWTIALLRLDSSPALLTAYARRVKRLESRARAFEAACATAPSSVHAEWAALCEELFAPNEELLGLTHDWLDARFPEAWRDEHGLSLARLILCCAPGVERASEARPAVAVLAGLDGLPNDLCDLIRVARNYRVRTDERLEPSAESRPLPELISRILAHRPGATNEELGALLNRAPATIRNNRR